MPAGTTTYSYSSDYPGDGFYTVSNGTFGNSFDWHQIQDHTPGDVNGKFLVINAATAAGEFYQTSISGLCENTTYEFSSWLINLVRAGTFCSAQPGGTIPINVRFEIYDSTGINLLAGGDTGNIVETASPNWQEFGLVFQTLIGQDEVILKMINNGAGGCGNDLAIDDIEFKTCGDLTIVEDAANNNGTSICGLQAPYATILTAIPDNSVFSSHVYQWQESNDGITWVDIISETNQTISISGITNTMYYRSKVSESIITVNNSQCNTLSNVYQVTVNPIVTPTFTQVSTICQGDAVPTLSLISDNSISGTWSPSVISNTVLGISTYTFAPAASECAEPLSISITVTGKELPTFSGVQPVTICEGGTVPVLPLTSDNSISGTWSPTAISNTISGTYTFTPDASECAETLPISITVTPNEAPIFTPVGPICNGDSLAALPTTSNNMITGTWLPAAMDNTATTTYTFTPDPGFCPSSVNLTIEVFDNPDVFLQNEYFICTDFSGGIISPTIIDTGLNTTMYNFTWLLNNVPIVGADQGTYMPIVEGNYEVMVQNLSTMCFNSTTTLVTALAEPDFKANVITDAFSANQTIQITTISTGEFEYRLDGGVWQDQPVFNNVTIGEHTVSVRDKRGCIESNRTVFVIGYPKYFTPNGDGNHETWNIVAPTSPVNFLASAEVYIFDRYGKLLKQINPIGEGWTGIFNGSNMPSDDYWFVVEYTEPNSGIRKEFRAHFALKR